ncbi:MAG: U32 family peptidase [Verrucomicrobiae bacterium]|nr:U32 family peptidase [Verrucomicrobiae bacterium]
MAEVLSSPPSRPPELLAPAGDWECARAAVENGADAIYFGLARFNARLRAQNFTEADLPELMTWLHRRGVRGYVAFNTLVFPGELAEAEAYLRTLIAADVDAAIVQDIGLCRLVRRLSPDFPIHASTQMTVTSAAGVSCARELGCQRVVLARENSITEIARIRDSLAAGDGGLPLEAFVHGALCVAYSGQCLTSEALGGRSANRGECAQACRLPYELLSDGKSVELGDRRYLLSPQDLAGLERLPDLARAGVSCLKIEGRLKSPEYVASIVRVYRAALDRHFPVEASGRPSTASRGRDDGATSGRSAGYEMEMAFSRGLHTGWLDGIDNQRLVHARFGKKRGVFLGTVDRVEGDRVWLRPVAPLKAGDGVVFDAGAPDAAEEGGRVFQVHAQRSGTSDVALSFLSGAVDLRRVRAGQRLWKTSDPELDRELRQSFGGTEPRYTRPVSAEVHGGAGMPMTLVVRDGDGHVARVASEPPLDVARSRPLDTDRLREQFGRLGGTPFHLGELTNRLEGPVILPLSELNRLRRAAVEELLAARVRPRRWRLIEGGASALTGPRAATSATSAGAAGGDGSKAPIDPIVLVRTLPQLEAALEAGVGTLYCEFEDPKRYGDVVARVRSRGQAAVYLAPPRVFKPGEDWILKQVRAAEPDGFLIRNHDHPAAFPSGRRVGDFSLNVANGLSAEYWLERHGLERVTASYDLNAEQLEGLLGQVPAGRLEITLHQHMPMFHMEHCVFCAFLSKGKDYRDCGRPCDRHALQLRDRVGAAHPVKADAGCRNTVFNARAQTGADHARRFVAAGARHFRIEFLDETAEETRLYIDRYRRLLRGELEPEALWREFRLVNQLGVTRGQLGRATGSDLGLDRWSDAAYAAAW